MKKLKCPKCDGAELNRIAVQLIDVDQCPKCEGVWFDHFAPELAEILKTGHDKLPEQLQKSWHEDVGLLRTADEKRYLCPRCSAELQAMWYAADAGKTFMIDSCPEGCGVWFDDGELGKAHRFLTNMKRAAAEKVMHGDKPAGILGKVDALEQSGFWKKL